MQWYHSTMATKALNLRLDEDEHTALAACAAATGRSQNEILRTALRSYLTDLGRQHEFQAALAAVQQRHRKALDALGDL